MRELTPEQIQITVAAFLTAQRHMNNAIKELRKMTEAIKSINGGKSGCFNPFDERGGDLSMSRLTDQDIVNYRGNLEKGCWRLLLRNTGIMDSVTETDYKRIESKINTGEMGTVSEENIAGVLRKLKNDEGSYVKNVAKEAFRYFSPDPVNKAPIRQKTVKNCGSYGSITFSSYHSPVWEVLEKALFLLDHQPFPEKYGDTLVGQMSDAVQHHQMDFECPYFQARFYEKSLTAHLTFTRMDLIDTINEIGRAA